MLMRFDPFRELERQDPGRRRACGHEIPVGESAKRRKVPVTAEDTGSRSIRSG